MKGKYPGGMTLTQWRRLPFRDQTSVGRADAQRAIPLLAHLRGCAMPAGAGLPGLHLLLAAQAGTVV